MQQTCILFRYIYGNKLEMTREEINAFYHRYRVRLFNTSYRILGDRMDAEEVMQDAMIKYLKSGISLELPKEEAWLVKSTVRGAIDMLRKKKRDLEFLEEYKADSIENMGDVKWRDGAEMVPKIKEGMARLPDGYRAVLSMILFEGFDYEEVAQIMDVKESTVRSQYMRGKERLIKIINEL